jgi:hypothetical protein
MIYNKCIIIHLFFKDIFKNNKTATIYKSITVLFGFDLLQLNHITTESISDLTYIK